MSRLALTLRRGESAVIETPEGSVRVKVTEIERGRVRVAIVAPAEWRVSREVEDTGEPPPDAASLLR